MYLLQLSETGSSTFPRVDLSLYFVVAKRVDVIVNGYQSAFSLMRLLLDSVQVVSCASRLVEPLGSSTNWKYPGNLRHSLD